MSDLRPLLRALAALPLLAAGAVVVYAATSGPPAPNGSVAVDCDALSGGIQANCAYPVGATFNVYVDVTAAPSGGYYGHQMKLRWNDPQLDYLPAATASNENLWPNCAIAIRDDNQTGNPPEPSVVFGCVPFPPLFTGKTTTGPILRFQFICQQAGSASLELVPAAGDPQNGSHFLDSQATQIDPALTAASISCTVAPTPTPTSTPSPTPSATPTVDPTLDSDTDGCTDLQELGPNAVLGGQRDPASFWDFFDTPDDANVRDRIVSTGDIVRILGRFGTNGDPAIDPLSAPGLSGYHTAFDRSAPAGDPWDLGPPDSTIVTNDILFAVNQFGHTCA